MFQSTHLHEVWLLFLYLLAIRLVSIHTPTWGVTDKRDKPKGSNDSFNPHTYMRCDFAININHFIIWVSIHTPTWGVTLYSSFMAAFFCCFNPHTYMRCDLSNRGSFLLLFFVSIHTPTWGVTAIYFTLTIIERFQSTHLHEVWQDTMWLDIIRSRFQSTHLHEVWLCREVHINHYGSFNPHTYMRCDCLTSKIRFLR